MRKLLRDMSAATLQVVGEPSETFVSAEVVAKRYGVTSRAVLLWAAQGIIPCVRIGPKTVRFSLGAVRAVVEKGGAR
jgi:hypothetical protein